MYRIIDDRGTGKTSRLMLLAKENNAVFVCANPNSMEYKAKAYGISGITFVSYGDFIHSFDPDITDYVVDELEDFVKYIFANGPKLVGYTLSQNE